MTSEPPPDGDTFANRLARLACRISAHQDFTVLGAATDTLRLVTEAAPQVRWATFTRRRGQRDEPRTAASTGPAALELDLLQYRHEEGPSYDALAAASVVVASDLAAEERWPAFTAGVMEHTPVRTVLSYPLVSTGNPDFTLNLYSDRAATLSSDDPALMMAATGAGFAMTAIAARQRADNLAMAMISNREIGTAMGLLMGRYDWTTDEAFDAIRRLSQRQHRKVRYVAGDVLKYGDLPACDPLDPLDPQAQSAQV